MANLHTLFDAEVKAAAEDAADLADPDGPFPDVHDLFAHFRDLYFGGAGALGGVSVEWSSARMTLCGGYCRRLPGGALIKLSQPLLSLRPARDLKMVLLHEMIHAHCMVTGVKDPDPSGHGPPFLALAAQINASTVPDPHRPAAGYAITVHHDWHAEVRHYRRHAWRCRRCRKEVWRAMNRLPQPADCATKEGPACAHSGCAYHRHLRECGGEWVKFAEPEGYVDKRKRGKAGEGGGGGRKAGRLEEVQRSIMDWVSGGGESGSDGGGGGGGGQTPTLLALEAVLQRGQTGAEPSAEARRRLQEAAALRRLGGGGGSGGGAGAAPAGTAPVEPPGASPDVIDLSGSPEMVVDRPTPTAGAPTAPCPVCGVQLPPGGNFAVNAHIDACLAKNA